MRTLFVAFGCCALFAGACSSPGPRPQDPVLTVTKDGTGSGSVTGSPAGIDCGATCAHAFSAGTAVTLTATADAGSVFVGWAGGGCSGSDSCQVVVSAATSVTATFQKQYTGPFTVKQTESLGGETISGSVCDVTKPFSVLATAKAVTWTFQFVPNSATTGAVTYAYTIPSAGESHDAKGTYTLSLPAPDGTLVLSMTVRDHVTFNGFDGMIPVRYKFSLVPAASCK